MSNTEELIQKKRNRYYLEKEITPEEKEELLTFCTYDPTRERWYCMSAKLLTEWVLNRGLKVPSIERKKYDEKVVIGKMLSHLSFPSKEESPSVEINGQHGNLKIKKYESFFEFYDVVFDFFKVCFHQKITSSQAEEVQEVLSSFVKSLRENVDLEDDFLSFFDTHLKKFKVSAAVSRRLVDFRLELQKKLKVK